MTAPPLNPVENCKVNDCQARLLSAEIERLQEENDRMS